jgi:hypothetical protein
MAIWTPINNMMNLKIAFAKFEGDKANLMLARQYSSFIVPARLPACLSDSLSLIGVNDKSFADRLTYFALNMAGIMAGIYKCSNLGLVPNKPADWLAFEGIKPAMEYATGGAAL